MGHVKKKRVGHRVGPDFTGNHSSCSVTVEGQSEWPECSQSTVLWRPHPGPFPGIWIQAPEKGTLHLSACGAEQFPALATTLWATGLFPGRVIRVPNTTSSFYYLPPLLGHNQALVPLSYCCGLPCTSFQKSIALPCLWVWAHSNSEHKGGVRKYPLPHPRSILGFLWKLRMPLQSYTKIEKKSLKKYLTVC